MIDSREGSVPLQPKKTVSAGCNEASKMSTPGKPSGPDAEMVATFTDAQLRVIIDLAEDGIVCVGNDQRIVLFNTGAEKIFGFKAREALGQPLDLLMPTEFHRQHQNHVCSFAAAPEVTRWMRDRVEVMGHRKDGTNFAAEVSISKAQINGAWLFTAIIRDVSERKFAEEAIRNSLREKEVLLQEVHHRVKNNLQIISSLLNLQARACRDPGTRNLFQDSRNRIHSMAMLHEQLHKHGNLPKIDCHRYIHELAAHVFHTYGVSTNQIRLVLESKDLRMNVEHAVPCGLILNELISNCLKHAFPDQRSGEIRIELQGNADCPEYLMVSDDGVGTREGAWDSMPHVGLRLVNVLAKQLGAAVKIVSRSGTQVTVHFNKLARQSRK
jgi:PAS domain S-box-containing protein